MIISQLSAQLAADPMGHDTFETVLFVTANASLVSSAQDEFKRCNCETSAQGNSQRPDEAEPQVSCINDCLVRFESLVFKARRQEPAFSRQGLINAFCRLR